MIHNNSHTDKNYHQFNLDRFQRSILRKRSFIPICIVWELGAHSAISKILEAFVKIILIVVAVLAVIVIIAWLVSRSAMQDIDDDY